MSILNLSDDQKLQQENMKWEAASCPFCFKKIYPFAAPFRAETAYTEQDLEDLSSEERKIKNRYLKKKDKTLMDFWNNYPGSKPNIKNEDNAVLYPVFDVNDPGNKDNVVRIFEVDQDGFPCGMNDGEGVKTTRRLCPHCHNQLPHEFGKYPVKYIPVVGITSSGKTVYLTQLLSEIEDYLIRVGLVPMGIHDETAQYVEEHPITRNKALPIGTLADKMTLPLPITVMNKELKKKWTVIFYDIAGENCVTPDKMLKYGKFIENADGILMIIDPLQFAKVFDLNVNDDRDPFRPERVVNAMYTAFGAASENATAQVPIAAAISKSDRLKPYFENNNIETRINHSIDYKPYKDKKGLVYNEAKSISYQLEQILETENQGEAFLESVKTSFENRAFFAFSALSLAPNKSNIMDEQPEAVRIEEPIYWLMYKLGIIPAAKPDGKREYSKINDSTPNGGLKGAEGKGYPSDNNGSDVKKKRGLFR